MNQRLVAAFRDSAHCVRESGAVQWRLVGLDRDSGTALEVLLSGAAALQLPARLAAAELYLQGDPANAAWELRSGGQVVPLAVRAVQVHRGAAAALANALPQVAAPWRARVGWVLLLNLLRVPGVPRLLRTLRGRDVA